MVTLEQLQAPNPPRYFHYRDVEHCTAQFKKGPRGGLQYKDHQYRVTGKLKTWKRTPNRFELPVKFGMYGDSDVISSSWQDHTDENGHYEREYTGQTNVWHSVDDCPILKAYQEALKVKYPHYATD